MRFQQAEYNKFQGIEQSSAKKLRNAAAVAHEDHGDDMDAQPSARGADLAGATATGARSHRGGASAAAPAPTVRCTQRGKKAQQLSQTAAKRARGQTGNRVGDATACTTACTLMQTVRDACEAAARPPRACAVRALAVLQIAGDSDEEGGSEYEVGGVEPRQRERD